MYVKFNIKNERLEWYKKRSIGYMGHIKQFGCISGSTCKVKTLK